MMLILDLCAGLGGASKAFRDRGWRVVTLDFDARFGCDITADLCAWSWGGERPDFVWISPPCTEFARESMPWCKTGIAPDMRLVNAARRVVRESMPRLGWTLENVRGAVPYLGKPRAIAGPFFLWGEFPPIGKPVLRMRKKESYSSAASAERAKIPYALSLAMCLAIESQHRMELVT